MQQAVVDFAQYLESKGVTFKLVEDGPSQGVWIPLGQTLRICGYRPPKEADPLDHIDTQRMLIGGRVQSAVKFATFLQVIAPFCTDNTTQRMGVEVANSVTISEHQTGRMAFEPEPTAPDDVLTHLERRESAVESSNDMIPGLGNLLSRRGTEFVLSGGNLRLVYRHPDPSDGDKVFDFFTDIFPEWRDDIDVKDGQKWVSPQLVLAYLKWAIAEYPDTYGHEVSHQLIDHAMQTIIDKGGEFGPRRTREKD